MSEQDEMPRNCIVIPFTHKEELKCLGGMRPPFFMEDLSFERAKRVAGEVDLWEPHANAIGVDNATLLIDEEGMGKGEGYLNMWATMIVADYHDSQKHQPPADSVLEAMGKTEDDWADWCVKMARECLIFGSAVLLADDGYHMSPNALIHLYAAAARGAVIKGSPAAADKIRAEAAELQKALQIDIGTKYADAIRSFNLVK